ncbi:MAG TPA: hypothetical protein ENK18_04730 [Deltaproteobacteria bacterium]|nr:hypothetical protein [Deltaproteobacteria bacterium]
MSHRVIARSVVGLLCCIGALRGPAAWADDPFRWTQPPPEVQLEEDRTPIAVGKGAVFVPSLTGPLNEPPALLVDESSEELLDIPTGERVLVDPGNYVVIVSSGSPGQGVSQAIVVEEGETSMVDVTWGALRIEVVDDRRVPHRGGYELIRADNRQPYGTGFGADTLQGERLRTWFLPPGVYRIVRPGSNYRALRDFATVYVPPGGFVRYRLVLDRDTGEFQGSGVLLPDEFGSPKDRNNRWFSSLVVGAVGSLVQQRNVIGVNNQLTASGSLFIDGQFAYNAGSHSASVLTQIEEGASQIRPQEGDPLPLVKARDRLRLDALYTYFLTPRLGPYVRAAAESQAFRTDVLVTEDTVVQRTYADGSVQQETVLGNETFFVADPWEPTTVREGGGLNMRLLNGRALQLSWRAGLGLRQNAFGGAWLLEDLESTPDIVEYRQVESLNQEGIESTLLATARLGGLGTYATDLELFADFQDPSRPSVEWRNTLTLRLTRNLALNYFLNLESLPQFVEATQLEQSVLLRASWALL